MHTAPYFNELVEQAVGLDNRDFDSFLTTVHHERAKLRERAIDRDEAELLEKINLGFPADKWERLCSLEGRLETSDLTAAEHSELAELVGLYEKYTLDRLMLLGKLAEKRGATLPEVMQQLGIRHETDG